MKTKLLICHLEPDFEPTNDLVYKIVNYAKLFPKYNDVIIIESASELSNTPPFAEMEHLYNNKVVKTWIWGGPDEWQIEDSKLKETEDFIWTKQSSHESAYIYEWMKELDKNYKYLLVGGGRWECLQDVYEILITLDYNVQIIENLTY